MRILITPLQDPFDEDVMIIEFSGVIKPLAVSISDGMRILNLSDGIDRPIIVGPAEGDKIWISAGEHA